MKEHSDLLETSSLSPQSRHPKGGQTCGGLRRITVVWICGEEGTESGSRKRHSMNTDMGTRLRRVAGRTGRRRGWVGVNPVAGKRWGRPGVGQRKSALNAHGPLRPCPQKGSWDEEGDVMCWACRELNMGCVSSMHRDGARRLETGLASVMCSERADWGDAGGRRSRSRSVSPGYVTGEQCRGQEPPWLLIKSLLRVRTASFRKISKTELKNP